MAYYRVPMANKSELEEFYMIGSQFRVLYGLLVVCASVVPVYIFYRFMSPVAARISYKSGKIAAQFGGPAALYIALIWILWGLIPPPPPCYQAWTIKGIVELQDAQEPLEKTDIAVVPSTTSVDERSGSFSMDVIAKPNPVGKTELPDSLVVSHKGYKSVTISLKEGKIPTGSGFAEVRVDRFNKVVNIDPFVLPKR